MKPKIPKKGVQARGGRRQYLECPEDMKRVEYLLKYTGCESFETEKDEFVGFKFEILETTHPSQKEGSEAGKSINKRGSKFSTFWDDFAPLIIAINGGDPKSQEQIDDFMEDADSNYDAVVDDGELVGELVRCVVYRYPSKADKTKTSWGMSWEPATKADRKAHA